MKKILIAMCIFFTVLSVSATANAAEHEAYYLTTFESPVLVMIGKGEDLTLSAGDTYVSASRHYCIHPSHTFSKWTGGTDYKGVQLILAGTYGDITLNNFGGRLYLASNIEYDSFTIRDSQVYACYFAVNYLSGGDAAIACLSDLEGRYTNNLSFWKSKYGLVTTQTVSTDITTWNLSTPGYIEARKPNMSIYNSDLGVLAGGANVTVYSGTISSWASTTGQGSGSLAATMSNFTVAPGSALQTWIHGQTGNGITNATYKVVEVGGNGSAVIPPIIDPGTGDGGDTNNPGDGDGNGSTTTTPDPTPGGSFTWEGFPIEEL